MNQTAIFWPLIGQVILIYGVYFLLSRRRMGAIAAGTARPAQFRENRDEPAESIFVHNNLLNQFQLPVLFFVVCICLYVTRGISTPVLAVAWIFVLSRYVHASVQVTSNRVAWRRPWFILGFFLVAALWLWLALHLLLIV